VINNDLSLNSEKNTSAGNFPTEVLIGTSFYPVLSGKNHFTINIDSSISWYRPLQFKFGLSLDIWKNINLKCGYNLNINNENSFAFGLGYTLQFKSLNQIQIEYANKINPYLGNSHFFNIAIKI
jgi:hypothetical protein